MHASEARRSFLATSSATSSFGEAPRPVYTTFAMRFPPRFVAASKCFRLLAFVFLAITSALASAYNDHPKLVVVIIIDQFRGDYLERYRDQFGEGGFQLFLDHGANFTDCNYDYANTRTAPGHATLFTGSYSNGHGIMANEWWDPKKKHIVTSVEDDDTKLVGVAGDKTGASPHNLLADTLGDELKLATQGHATSFWGVIKRPRRGAARGLRRRCGLLDRAEEWHLGHFHLLSLRLAQVGAGFQLQQPRRKILGPRLEK